MFSTRNSQLFVKLRKIVINRAFGINESTLIFYEEMPKSKEYLSSDDSESDHEKAPKRKQEEKSEKAESSKKPKKSSKEDEEEPSWELGSNKVVKVREFKGKLLIDIREMYLDKLGDMKPGKKGISLNMSQWRKFMDCVEEVDKIAKNKC